MSNWPMIECDKQWRLKYKVAKCDKQGIKMWELQLTKETETMTEW